MATRSTVDISGALRKMQALANVLQRPLRDVLDSGARTCAISLAKSTQPDGTGAEALARGQGAVRRDILRVYGSAGGVHERISNGRLKSAFWKHYKAGHFDEAANIAKGVGIDVGDFDGGAAHRSLRGTRIPVIRLRQPKIYIIKPRERQKLQRYIEFHQREVGTAKGGWVDVVRFLGGTPRGLRQEGDITANWITRKARGAGTAIRGGSDFDPRIRITNRIPYIDQLLSQSARNYAEGIARHRMIQNLEYAVKAEARKLKSAA
jgi:hypothetical protein